MALDLYLINIICKLCLGSFFLCRCSPRKSRSGYLQKHHFHHPAMKASIFSKMSRSRSVSKESVLSEEIIEEGETEERFFELKLYQLCGDSMRSSRLVEILLEQHSPFVMKLRFLSFLQDYENTTCAKDKRRKGKKIVDCFFEETSLFHLYGIPTELIQDLKRFRFARFESVRKLIVTEMFSDNQVCNIVTNS